MIRNFEAHDSFEPEMTNIINNNFRPEALEENKLSTLQEWLDWQVNDARAVEDVGVSNEQEGCDSVIEHNVNIDSEKRAEKGAQEESVPVSEGSTQLFSTGSPLHNVGFMDDYFHGCRIEPQDGANDGSFDLYGQFALEKRSWRSIVGELYADSDMNQGMDFSKSNMQTVDGHLGHCSDQSTLPIPLGGYAPIGVAKMEETFENSLDGSFAPALGNQSLVARTSNSRKHTPKTNLAWLIDNGAISLMEELSYMNKNGLVMAKGKATREGILCDCCDELFTLSNFETHARSSNHRPAEHIYLPDGRTLSECHIEALKRTPREVSRLRPQKRRKKNQPFEDDFICSICSDGGDLLLCDSCPSAYHPACVGLQGVPEGTWFCRPCQCVICEKAVVNAHIGTVLECNQCECKYHVECRRDSGLTARENNLHNNWFCSEQCSKIHAYLLNCVGKPNPTNIEGVSWTLWRFRKEDDRAKLNLAIELLHECFKPMFDNFSGRDIRQDIVLNQISSLKRLNFRGFYTMILEKGDELISVATLRICGEKVAEVPLICTHLQHRRKGMYRLLVTEIEKMLTGLGVERLILPSVPELMETWKNSFGFSIMTSEERLKLLEWTLLNFGGSTMLQKVLRPPPDEANEGKESMVEPEASSS